jgi:hypothetical protein
MLPVDSRFNGVTYLCRQLPDQVLLFLLILLEFCHFGRSAIEPIPVKTG